MTDLTDLVETVETRALTALEADGSLPAERGARLRETLFEREDDFCAFPVAAVEGARFESAEQTVRAALGARAVHPGALELAALLQIAGTAYAEEGAVPSRAGR